MTAATAPGAAARRQLGAPPVLAGIAAIAVIAGVFAVRQPGLAFAGAAAVAVIVLAIRSYTLGVALFATLTFFEGAPGFAGTLSVVKLLTLVLLVSWGVLVARERPQPLLFRDRPVVFACMLLLFAWAAASAWWAVDVHASESGAFRLVQMLLLLVLVFTAVKDRRDLWLFAWAFVLGAVLTSLVALVGIGSGAGGGGARFGGYLGNPNNLAAVVLPALALSGFMAIGSGRRLERLLLGACAIVLLVTLFLTQSRGGLIGLVAMVIAAVVLAGPARRRAVQLLVLLAIGGVAYFEMFASAAARHRATEFSAAQSTGRVDLWHVAVRMFESHPVQGVGLDNFTGLAPGYVASDFPIQRADLFLRPVATQVHNTYLTVLAELGLVGEVLFLALLLGIFFVAGRAITTMAVSADRRVELVSRGLLVGAIGMVTAYVFFSAQYEKQLWLVLGALLSLSTVAATSVRRQGATRSRPRRRAP